VTRLRRDAALGGDNPPAAKRPVLAARLGTLEASAISLEGDNPSMALADAQQQRPLERLRDEWQKRSRLLSVPPFTDGKRKRACVCQRH
jgi:hypothetical protein